MWEHKNSLNEGFSKKYILTRLVYYEVFSDSKYAIAREKQLKNWHRQWKINLIKENNPKFTDLSKEWDCFQAPKDPETSSG
jgi:putative endonuclease